MVGVNAKINRAREDLQTLEADMAALCEYERRRRVFEIKQGWPVIVSENIPEAPIGYSIRIGEIAYNLRSALDHLVWQLVIYNRETPTRRTAFPVFSKKAQFRRWAKRRLDEMTQGQIEVIKLVQPFGKDNGVGPHLWMLNSICNIDKHRHLNVVAIHSVSDVKLKEGADPNLTWPLIGGLALVDILKGTEHEDKMNIDVITGICFMDEDLDKDLRDVRVEYGSAIEKEGVKWPPVGPALWGCLTAVQFVVDRCNSLFMLGNSEEPTQ